jgi:hypothetical protein
MKKFTFLLFLFIALRSYAQQDSAAVEQYCEVVVTELIMSNKVAIDIDYGEERKRIRDNRLKEENGKLKKFNTVIDALNYLGKNGWKLVNAFPFNTRSGPTDYHYVFRKEFLKTDIE